MITIIGAGPAGSYTAYLLAKQNKDVSVFEEHKNIGLPVQCTGITTNLLKNIIHLKKDFVVNQISKARIFSPKKKFIEISFKEKNIIINRHKFDNYLANMAKDVGAKFFLSHKFISNNKKEIIIKDKINDRLDSVPFDHLIGADGPLSQVAKSNHLFGKREFWQGIQARVKIKNENIVEFYPYFGTYAWVVPEDSDTARVGLVSNKYANVLFKNFLFKFKGSKKEDIIEYQAGIIPKYNPKIKTQLNNTYLVGDAACQVKATTGGGIIQGLIAAKALSESIKTKKSYERLWKDSLGRDLYFHLKVRNRMDKFKEKDWNKLIDIMDSEEIRMILGRNNRDNIFSILLRMAAKKPSLLYFIKYLFY